MIGVSASLRPRAAGCFSWRTLAGLAISAALAGGVLRHVDLAQVGIALGRFSPAGIVSGVLLIWLSLPLRAVQWQRLLGCPPEASFLRVVRALCIGYAANALLPMRGGELVRAYALAYSTGRPFAQILPSVALARLLDLPAAVLLVAFLPFVLSLDSEAARAVGISISPQSWRHALGLLALTTAGVGGAVAMVVVGSRKIPDPMRRTFREHASRLQAGLVALKDAVRFLSQPRLLGESLGLTGMCWALFVGSQVPLLHAFGVEGATAWSAAVAVTGLTTAAHLLPSAPGALGTFHAFCAAALLLSVPGIPPADALAYAVVAHLVGLLAPVIPGMVLWPRCAAGRWARSEAPRPFRTE